MWRIVNILLSCSIIGCTSPYIVLTREQSTAIETYFNEFGTRHQLTVGCDLYNTSRDLIDLETGKIIEPQRRWTQVRTCRCMWYDADSVIHVIALSNWRDNKNTLETWSLGTIAQTERPFEVHRLDTLFARSSDLRTFYDSIPSYLEQAYRWTVSKQRSDLPRVWPKK